MEVGDARMSMCELRIISIICNDSSFERIPCDLRSRSLEESTSYDMKENAKEVMSIPFGI